MATAKALVDQTGGYSQWTASAESGQHCLIWLRGNATRQIKRTSQRLQVIDGCAWITFEGKDQLVRRGEELRLVPGRDAAVISCLDTPVLIFTMID
jgi:hypothetical protein